MTTIPASPATPPIPPLSLTLHAVPAGHQPPVPQADQPIRMPADRLPALVDPELVAAYLARQPRHQIHDHCTHSEPAALVHVEQAQRAHQCNDPTCDLCYHLNRARAALVASLPVDAGGVL